MTVYLLHLDEPVAHAQHYLGWTGGEALERVQTHLDGRGAAVVRAASGLAELVRVWPGGGLDLERELKRLKNSRRLCPKCRDEWRERQKTYPKGRRDAGN